MLPRHLSSGVVGAFVMAGCSAAPAPRVVEQELGAVPSVAARICVVRPDELASDVTMEVKDNGRLVGATRGSTFVCWLAQPGAHQIASHDDTGPTFLRAKAGHHYWLHQEVATLDGELHTHLDWIDDATASEMLATCRTRVRVAVPGHDRSDMVAVTPRQ